MENILFLISVDKKRQQDFIAEFPNEAFLFQRSSVVTQKEIDWATIIIGNPPVQMLSDKLSNLKWLQLISAGYNEYIKAGVLPKKTILSNARGAYGLAVSEHVVAQCMMLMRKLHLYLHNQGIHSWKREGKVKSIDRAKVGIIGLGDIGCNIAKRFNSLGAEVVGYVRNPLAKNDFVTEMRDIKTINENVSDLDVLVLCVPYTSETFHLVDSSLLSQAPHDLILINVGRGELINTKDLINHMEANSDFMAALDVFEKEPLPQASLLWDLPNLVITPHVAGGFHLEYTKESVLKIVYDNLRRYIFGDYDLENIIQRQL